MAYKKTVKLRFESKKDFDQINNQLENAGLELSSFATFCLNRVWSEIIQEHQRQLQQLKETNDAANSEQSSVDTQSEQISESSDSEKPQDEQAISN